MRSRLAALLSGLPRTSWPSDVRRWAAPYGDAHVEFLRTPLLDPSGEALVHLGDDGQVRALVQGRAARIGGELIHVRELEEDEVSAYVARVYGRRPADQLMALDVAQARPLQSVLLRNAPRQTTAEKLARKLERSYRLAPLPRSAEIPWTRSRLRSDDALPDGPILPLPSQLATTGSASFLVLLESAGEAARLVRSWHRTRFIPQRYTLASAGDRYIVDAQLMY